MIDCTVLVMTHNEEANIEKCLTSISGRFSRTCLVDSYSDDNTTRIVKGFSNVEMYQNHFISFGDQRNWLLQKAQIETSYVLFLDADEVISEPLFEEISGVVSKCDADIASFPVVNFFMGKAIKHAYGHPDVVRLFKVSSFVGYVTEGARDYPVANGKEVKLKSYLHHEDLKPFDVWLKKHIMNAQREVEYNFLQGKSKHNQGFKTLIRTKVWSRLPLSFRPVLYFIYRYLLMGGFLDGYPGFIFCFFQALSYQTMISALTYIEKSKP